MFKRDHADPTGDLTVKGMMPLFWPVFIEQSLSILIGIVSTIMVSNVGAYAVSGVNLVDTINFMVISVFNALAAGATVVVSQKIGSRNMEQAAETAQQSIVVCVLLALVLGLCASAGSGMVLRLLYGAAAENVLQAGHTYFIFSGFSYAFLGLSASCAGVMRACGNPRTPMIASIAANIVNVVTAFVLIRIGMGVVGVSIAMLLARATGGLFCFVMLRSGRSGIVLPKFSMKLSMDILRPVLKVGVPSGVDSVIFNGARVVLTVFLSGMGTEALHANAIGNSLSGFLNLPGNTFSINIVTLTGRAFGARLYGRVKRLTLRCYVYAALSQLILFIPFFIFLEPLISIYGATQATMDITRTLLTILGLLTPIFWPAAFMLPQMLRACGDATPTMVISVLSLVLVRLTGAWFFGLYLEWGVLGVWMGMFSDWIARGCGFAWRFLSNKWNGGLPPENDGDTTTALW